MMCLHAKLPAVLFTHTHFVPIACTSTARMASPHTKPNTSQQLPLLNLYLSTSAPQAAGKSAIIKTSTGTGAVSGSKAAAQGKIGTTQSKQSSSASQKVKHVAVLA